MQASGAQKIRSLDYSDVDLTANRPCHSTRFQKTITVTRTAGGVFGEVNESVYTGPSDSGSNFRIDGCQYHYNLTSNTLGVGTYRVDILINGQVVGSATFQLK